MQYDTTSYDTIHCDALHYDTIFYNIQNTIKTDTAIYKLQKNTNNMILKVLLCEKFRINNLIHAVYYYYNESYEYFIIVKNENTFLFMEYQIFKNLHIVSNITYDPKTLYHTECTFTTIHKMSFIEYMLFLDTEMKLLITHNIFNTKFDFLHSNIIISSYLPLELHNYFINTNYNLIMNKQINKNKLRTITSLFWNGCYEYDL